MSGELSEKFAKLRQRKNPTAGFKSKINANMFIQKGKRNAKLNASRGFQTPFRNSFRMLFQNPEDGSSICVPYFNRGLEIFEHFIVRTPDRTVQDESVGFEIIDCVFFYQKQSNMEEVECILRYELAEMVSNRVVETKLTDQAVIVGFDTETGTASTSIDLLQLTTGSKCVLIHRSSGLFSSAVLNSFFGNKLFVEVTLIFCGAELASWDCLDMLKDGLALHGILDLTPVYSQWRHRSVEYATRAVHFLDEDIISLNLLLENISSIKWHKNKDIFCSNWALSALSPPQLKYAVLDAWASCKVGIHTASKMLDDWSFGSVFSTAGLDPSLLTDSSTILNEILSQSKAMEKSQIGYKAIAISNLQWDPTKGVRHLRVVCTTYGRHLRWGSVVEIRVLSPGGLPGGIVLDASIVSVKGQRAELTVHHLIRKVSSEPNLVDRAMMAQMSSREVCKEIVVLWRREDDKFGAYTASDSVTGPRNIVRVRLFAKDKDDRIHQQIRLAISRFIRSHVVGPEFFARAGIPRGPHTPVFRSSAAIQRDSRLTTAFDIISGREFVNTTDARVAAEEVAAIARCGEKLRESQHKALENAFKYQVSVIKGPPGTGKTRTIAAIADVALAANRRILVLAPANSASRRILESLTNTGFKDACLTVSEEYFFEWHQDSYADSLSQFVHTKTKKVVESQHDNRAQGGHSDHSAEGRAARDFGVCREESHQGKWTTLAKGTGNRSSRKPSVVIGTYGCIVGSIIDFAAASKKNGRKAKSWGMELNNLINANTIDMIIIDETSQLWYGYVLNLFTAFPSLRNVVLVGDDQQLPPYGSDEIPGLHSLFSMALQHPNIPATLLDITFRLPPAVASLVSNTVYEGKLQVSRCDESDAAFSALVRGLKFQTNSSMHPILAQHLRFKEIGHVFSSLMWIHIASPQRMNPESRSHGNLEEAKLVAQCFAELLVAFAALVEKMKRAEQGLTPWDKHKFVILTPYLEQKAKLEAALAKALYGFRYLGKTFPQLVDFVKSSLLVNTVDSFQGQEADIVFISTVRANGMGFFKNQKRANVMLTRSSQLLVIVGNADNMASHFEGYGPGLPLLPAMAQWTFDHQAMFTITDPSRPALTLKTVSEVKEAGHQESGKEAEKKQDAAGGSTRDRAEAAATVASVRGGRGPDVRPRVQPAAVKQQATSQCDRQTDRDFARRVLDMLAEHDGALSLSRLGELIPKSERPPSYRSLIQPVRDIPGVSVTLSDSVWQVVLSLEAQRKAAVGKKAKERPSKISSTGQHDRVKFVALVLDQIQRRGGRITLSELGATVPPDMRRPTLSALLALHADEFRVVGMQVTRCAEKVAMLSFADAVIALLKKQPGGSGSGSGSMSLGELGSRFPPSSRPGHPQKKISSIIRSLENTFVIKDERVFLSKEG